MILMQTVPTHIKIQEIQERLVERIPGVLGVHEFHIWQLAGNRIIGNIIFSFIFYFVSGNICLSSQELIKRY